MHLPHYFSVPCRVPAPLPPDMFPSLQVQQMSIQLQTAAEAASQAEEMLETEQIEKRGLEEQLSEITVSVSSVSERSL